MESKEQMWRTAWLSDMNFILDEEIKDNFDEREIGWYSRDKILKKVKQKLNSKAELESSEDKNNGN